MSGYPVRPGDWFVVNTGTRDTALITAAEKIGDFVRPTGYRWTDWDHAGVCTGVRDDGTIEIVEAEPSGAHLTTWHYEDRPHQWSSGLVAWPDPDAGVRIANTAVDCIGTKYAWLDYAALTAHDLRIPAPGLRDFIASTHTMICSQYVDYCCLNAGVHLFSDNRWAGYVTPSDLGALLVPPR